MKIIISDKTYLELIQMLKWMVHEDNFTVLHADSCTAMKVLDELKIPYETHG